MSPTFYFLAILWIVFLVNFIVPFVNLNQFGIRPRSLDGLLGIIISPFLHGNLRHLIANSIPLVILPLIAQLALSQRAVVQVMVIGGLGSGIGTWCFGSGATVVGASGVVFALLGFLLARAYFRPSLMTVLTSGFVFLTYGGALLSLLSANPFISWAAHFWGFCSGVVIARFMEYRQRQ